MLNSPCLNPPILTDGERVDFDAVAAYYSSKAKCLEACAAVSFGHIREHRLAEASKWRRSAIIATDIAHLERGRTS